LFQLKYVLLTSFGDLRQSAIYCNPVNFDRDPKLFERLQLMNTLLVSELRTCKCTFLCFTNWWDGISDRFFKFLLFTKLLQTALKRNV